MQRILITFLVCLLGVLSYGQKLDKYGRKIVKSVVVDGKIQRAEITYAHNEDGLVVGIDAVVEVSGSYSFKMNLCYHNGSLIQNVDGKDYPATIKFVVDDDVIREKHITIGPDVNSFEYEYSEYGMLSSVWTNYRNLNKGGIYEYEPGVWRHDFIWGEMCNTSFVDQYYEYDVLPRNTRRLIPVYGMTVSKKGSPQYHNNCIVFSDNENDTNLCIESFIDLLPQFYINGLEYTCDWMGTLCRMLPDYFPTQSKVQVGNRFLSINKGLLYEYDSNGNMTGFSVSYDHDYCGYKAYETLYRVNIKYVE